MDKELLERLHDVDYVITSKEIKDLQDICYGYGNSYFPIDMFFNDIRNISSEQFNKNQAYKDLYLIILYFDYYFRKSEEVEALNNGKVG